MGFLSGLIMFLICHTVANIFANNLYCYIQEEKAEDVNRYAMKQYLINTIVSFVVYIVILIISLTVEAFSEYITAILIGNGIGFITAFIHFRVMAEDNYMKQKAKNEWNSWNYMSFEEKRETLKKQEVESETTYHKVPTNYQEKKSTRHIDDCSEKSFTGSQSYVELILEYFEVVKGLETNIEVAPNGDEIIIVDYQINYLWTLCIKIDEDKEMIKVYTPFFNVASSKRNDIYEVLNDWNHKFFFTKFFFENTVAGPFVIASYDVPLSTKDSIGQFVFNIADEFIRTIDEQFRNVPRDIIEV